MNNNINITLIANKGYEINFSKKLIVDLTRHLESIEILYNDVNNEIEKRIKR